VDEIRNNLRLYMKDMMAPVNIIAPEAQKVKRAMNKVVAFGGATAGLGAGRREDASRRHLYRDRTSEMLPKSNTCALNWVR